MIIESSRTGINLRVIRATELESVSIDVKILFDMPSTGSTGSDLVNNLSIDQTPLKLQLIHVRCMWGAIK